MNHSKVSNVGGFEADGQIPVDALRTFLRSALSQKFDVAFLACRASSCMQLVHDALDKFFAQVPLQQKEPFFSVKVNLEAKILLFSFVNCLHVKDTPKSQI